MKLDIGCGMKVYGTHHSLAIRNDKSYIHVDKDKSTQPDVIAKADELPFADGTIDEIACFHTLEHVNDDIAALKEFHRVLKAGAKAKIIVPYAGFNGSFLGSIHKHHFALGYFGHFHKDFPHKYADFSFSNIRLKLKFVVTRWTFYNKFIEWLANKYPWAYENTILSIFPCQELHAEMIK